MRSIVLRFSDEEQGWIEARAKEENFATIGDKVAELGRRNFSKDASPMTLTELRQLVAEAEGVSPYSVDDLFEQASRSVRPVEG